MWETATVSVEAMANFSYTFPMPMSRCLFVMFVLFALSVCCIIIVATCQCRCPRTMPTADDGGDVVAMLTVREAPASALRLFRSTVFASQSRLQA